MSTKETVFTPGPIQNKTKETLEQFKDIFDGIQINNDSNQNNNINQIEQENKKLKKENERLQKKNDELNLELIQLRMFKLMYEKNICR